MESSNEPLGEGGREKGIKPLDESLGRGFLPHGIHLAVKTFITAVKSLFNTWKVPVAELTFISQSNLISIFEEDSLPPISETILRFSL